MARNTSSILRTSIQSQTGNTCRPELSCRLCHTTNEAGVGARRTCDGSIETADLELVSFGEFLVAGQGGCEGEEGAEVVALRS